MLQILRYLKLIEVGLSATDFHDNIQILVKILMQK